MSFREPEALTKITNAVTAFLLAALYRFAVFLLTCQRALYCHCQARLRSRASLISTDGNHHDALPGSGCSVTGGGRFVTAFWNASPKLKETEYPVASGLFFLIFTLFVNQIGNWTQDHSLPLFAEIRCGGLASSGCA